jgi:hydroxymethylbilane synthase
VASEIERNGEVSVELVPLSTEGDRRLSEPLSVLGGKGVFVSEVQAAVLDGRADLAVHSAKDMPARGPDALCIAAFPERADARDALVGCRLADLGEGSVVATGSPRRQAILADLVPGIRCVGLRGNIDTRLSKVGEFDAIVMAAAALERLDRHPHVVDLLSVDRMVPQVGQGSLAVECRAAEDDIVAVLGALDHPATRRNVETERAFLLRLGGDCQLPAGAHAVQEGNDIALTGVLLGPTGLCRTRLVGANPSELGTAVAEELLARVGA